MAALPLAPVMVLLFLFVSRHFSPADRHMKFIAGGYATLLLLPACFAPHPLLALGGAGLKIVITLSLLAAGQRLRESQALAILIPGLFGVLLLALLYSFGIQHLLPFTDRLQHPYFTSISLGFTGAVALWLAVLLPRSAVGVGLRLLAGLIALILLAMSGSRGALLAVIAGLAAAAAQYVSLHWPHPKVRTMSFIGTGLLLLGGLMAGKNLPSFSDPVLTHLTSTSSNGRDITWADTLNAIQAHPLTGYGPFQLGPQIAPAQQVETCQWWPALEERGLTCPGVVKALNNTWLIAHNAALQSLGESGPLGLLAQVTLCAYLLLQAWRSRQPLLLAVLVGLFTGDLTDNVSMVPGPFFTALPWIAGGMALSQARASNTPRDLNFTPWLALALLTAWSFPIWANAVSQSGALGHPVQKVTLHEVIAAPVWKGNDPYPILLVASAPAGQYRVQTRVCNAHGEACHTMDSPPVQSAGSTPGITQAITIPAPPPGSSRLQVIVRPDQPSPLNTRPLAQYGWPVTRSDP